jgi:hypothetical protein
LATAIERQKLPAGAKLQVFLEALERQLASDSVRDREEAIRGLWDLGPAAAGALPSIAKAVGDPEESVAYKAFQMFEQLCPQSVLDQFPGLPDRLQGEGQVRLQAIEELVRLLPPLQYGDRGSKEDPVISSPRPLAPAGYEGKWIVRRQNDERILGAADTYPEILELAKRLGRADLVVERAPGIDPDVAAKPFELLNGESPDIEKDIRETIPDADRWLDSPNAQLWFQKPRDLIGTPQERELRYLLRGIWSGITS